MSYMDSMNVFRCSRCNAFQALTLRGLLNHYFTVHSNETNFRVVCGVNNCPAIFTKYNSLYKHVTRQHREAYDVIQECNTANRQEDIHQNSHGVGGDSDVNPASNAEASDTDQDEAMDNEDQVDSVDIQRSAASFILKVKERNKLPQTAMNTIIESTSCLVNQMLKSVKQKLVTAIEPCGPENLALLAQTFNEVPDPFSGIKTEALCASYIKKTFNYVEYKEVSLGKKLVRKKKKQKLVISEKDETFIYIPIIESLNQLLSNKRIAAIILRKPKLCEDGVLYDICDGSIYQNDEYFKEHPDALVLILYHDELEVCNPLGSKAGTHKVDMFYYTVANLGPKFRSKVAAVRLLAIANANLVKKYGIESIMKPIIQDINILYHGVQMWINGVERSVFGKVLSCNGDTLGQHLWGGYKEGVGVACQKCRTCYCIFEKMQMEFLEEAFTLRTQESYDRECIDIEEAPTDAVRSDLCTTYGINKRSSLCDLPDFDITKQLPQDIMHTLLEGTIQYELRLLLHYFMQTREITLEQINSAIVNHNYGYSENCDKPGPLRESIFQGEAYKLKYNASQTRLFLRILPFILGPLIDTSSEYYSFLVEIIKITQIVFSPVISEDTLQRLHPLINEHLLKFKVLFPGKNIIPKQHYLIHIPGMIRSLGPMIRSSCFTFESAHRYFKELAKKQNFKNLPLSLAKRHQFLECCNFGDAEECPSSHPFFATEKQFIGLQEVGAAKLSYLQEKFQEFGLLPGLVLKSAYKANSVILYGTTYTKAAVLAVGLSGDPPVPIFGELHKIWIVGSYIYFETLLLETDGLDHVYQAYQVRQIVPAAVHFVASDSLLDYNVFHVKQNHLGSSYVAVKYDINDIMHEHLKGTNPLHNN